VVTDPMLPTLSCGPVTLAPGASATCTQTYTVTQADINAGSIYNTASATGYFGNTPYTDTDDNTVNVTTGPSITLTKTSTPSTVTTAGQVITYTLVAQNTGNVTLTNVVVTDPMLPTLSCGPVSLAPGASATCTQTYTVTQADINAGSIYNTASATGYFGNTPYTDTDDNTVHVTQSPALTIDKLITSGSSYNAVGNVVNYSYIITNTGNVTLSGPFTVTDNKIPNIPSVPGPLAPYQSVTATASYTITQADLNNGNVTNTAFASTTYGNQTVTSNTDVATANATVSSIIANNDIGTTVNSFTGGTGFTNVLVNDLLNGNPVTPSLVNTTFISSTHPGVTLSGTNVLVAPGTPAGTYYLVYQICEVSNPTNCDQATVTIYVAAPVIVANDDTGAPVQSTTGGTAITNVLTNDMLSGAPVVASQVSTTFVSSTHPGVTLVGTSVVVTAGTPPGSYTLTYQICEITNPTNCDQAIVTVQVLGSSIEAIVDYGAVVQSSTGGVSVLNVLVNDVLNGAIVNPADVQVIFITTTNPGVTLSGTTVNVAPGTPPGNYQLIYRICEIANPSNCDTARVFVPVITQTLIVANDDMGSTVNSYTGGTAFTNVLTNDLLNGAPVIPSQVNTTFVSSSNPGVTLVGTNVVVAPGTPAGTYTLVYQICEITNPTNCDQATVTVIVSAPLIIANDDLGNMVNGYTGGTAFNNVLVNDLLNGAPVVPSQVNTTFVSSTNPGVTLVGTNVLVAPGTPAGTYYLVYQICEITNPANCDQATVTVFVGSTIIIANDDTGVGVPVNGYNGGTSFSNVLVNDLLNGMPVIPSQVTTTFVSSTNPGVTLVGTNVVVAPGTPAGTYYLVYQICEVLNPSNCDMATVTVVVTAPSIVANDDMGNTIIDSAGGISFSNILGNDLLNGLPVASSQVTVSFISSTHPGVTLVGTDVVVAPYTPAGTYSLIYQICDLLNPTNCDQATVVVPVITSGTSPVCLDANGDIGGPVNGYTGGLAFTNVLVNDLYNGNPVLPNQVTTTFVFATHPGLYLMGNNVYVAPGTPAGTYFMTYQICEVINPTSCDQAIVIVTVTAPVIVANDDIGVTVNGYTGGVGYVNVLVNDSLNGAPVIPSQVNTSFISSSHAGISLLGNAVMVAAGTPAGTYTLVYRICEVINPTNCDQATVTVNVVAAPIVANDDMGTTVSSFTGGLSLTNILGNDLLNGAPIILPTDVNTTFISSTHPGVTLVGYDVWVAPGTPAGTYYLVYQICEVLNPANCDQATVTVMVNTPVIVANDDSGAPVNGYAGGTSFVNVLVNDSLNGLPVNASQVSITQISTTHPNISLVGTDVVVAPNIASGTYYLVYEICDLLNPTNCDLATVTVPIPVCSACLSANSDIAPPVNGVTGGMAFNNVLVNDLLNGVPVLPSQVTISSVLSTHPGVTLVGTDVWVAPGTPPGTYYLIYEICEVLNPSNCDQAFVTVTLFAGATIEGIVDYGAPVSGYTGGVSAPNVLVNDLLNGVLVNPGDVSVMMIYTPNSGISMVGNSVVVAPGTPAGNYGLIYRICEIASPFNCDTAIVWVPVTAPSIIAVADYSPTVNGFAGGVAVPDVLVNDLINAIPVQPSQVSVTLVSSSDPAITLSGTSVIVAPGTPTGNYTLIYQICEVINPANCDTAIVYVTVMSAIQACVSPKVFLQGPFDPATGLMWDSLRVHNFIPATEPYSSPYYSSNFAHAGGGGGETIAAPSMVFGVSGNNAIVDWVFIELRDRNNSSQVLHTRSALLQRDGDIVDVDGVSPVCFYNLSDTAFYVAIRHRNHLGVMTAAPKPLLNAPVIDFRYGQEPEFNLGNSLNNGFNYTGLSQMQLTIGTRGLWAGDVDMNRRVKYQGGISDRSVMLSIVLGIPGNVLNEYNYDFGFGYYNGDVDLSGKAKYQGSHSDRSQLLNYILNYPLNNTLKEYNFDFFIEQLP
jgi:large repetitive protein